MRISWIRRAYSRWAGSWVIGQLDIGIYYPAHGRPIHRNVARTAFRQLEYNTLQRRCGAILVVLSGCTGYLSTAVCKLNILVKGQNVDRDRNSTCEGNIVIESIGHASSAPFPGVHVTGVATGAPHHKSWVCNLNPQSQSLVLQFEVLLSEGPELVLETAVLLQLRAHDTEPGH